MSLQKIKNYTSYNNKIILREWPVLNIVEKTRCLDQVFYVESALVMNESFSSKDLKLLRTLVIWAQKLK